MAHGKPFSSSEENLGRAPKYTHIKTLLDKHNESLVETKTLNEIFDGWAEMKAVKGEYIIALSKASVDEFVIFFKSLKGSEPAKFLEKCSSFVANADGLFDYKEYQNRIMCSSYEAITKISSQSKLNAQRTARFLQYYRVSYESAKNYLSSRPADLGDLSHL
jgi:hypothetical protein